MSRHLPRRRNIRCWAPECKAADTDDAAAAYDGTAAEPLLVVLKGAHADVLPESSELLSEEERVSWSETAGLWPEASAPHIACRRKCCQSFWRTAAGSTPSRSPLR